MRDHQPERSQGQRAERGNLYDEVTSRIIAELEAGRVRAVMSIAIQGEQSGKVIKALNGFPQVERIYTTNGRWDLVAEINTATLADFSAALDQIRLIEGIAATETSLLLASAK